MTNSFTPNRRFGKALRAWFKHNEWPQLITEQVAKAAGSTTGPWASQICNAMQNDLEPKPAFFCALGWFNLYVSEGDFSGITDRKLLDRLNNGCPLMNEEGKVYSSVDFFALYIGELWDPCVWVTKDGIDECTPVLFEADAQEEEELFGDISPAELSTAQLMALLQLRIDEPER